MDLYSLTGGLVAETAWAVKEAAPDEVDEVEVV
jgi:hypothetical protein